MTWDLLIKSPVSVSLPINAAVSHYITNLLLFEGIGHGFDIFRQYIRENGSDSLTCMVLPGPFTCVQVRRRSIKSLLSKYVVVDSNDFSDSRNSSLANSLTAWFRALGYGQESHEVWAEDYFEWIITIPMRRGYDRILVRGVADEAGISDVRELHNAFLEHNTDEGWLISNRRISSAARRAVSEEKLYEHIYCLTLDELLDQNADFSNYLVWLEHEIQMRGIDKDYIPLACLKDEVDPATHQKIGVSFYGEEDGWIDGYIDQWLNDPVKEHLSILGEFGTGKTSCVLHYAWQALKRYKEAKTRGLARPRLPIVIPLKDYSKAVSVESLLSEFFFRKHEVPLPGYAAFEELNRMGKLLLIFDGFDEMAARVNRQAMIDNFWELAKVVVPGAKAILTCRTEHFPEAIEGRRLLNAELNASTASLTGEPPQFEVLELAKLSDDQISQLLGRYLQEGNVQKVMGNQQLLDLARRPVMTNLILEALPEVEAGRPVDMSRIYLYAITTKMERDIKSERTFTSLADKLYFLCELSWEMLSTDQMSLNYRAFPERLKQMFGALVENEVELDHWRYDMMGQTMLIRNSEGDYSPAHRSLLEFFVAYKFAAELGILAEDFLSVAREQSFVDISTAPQNYQWFDYFNRQQSGDGEVIAKSPLNKFITESIQNLQVTFGQSTLPKAILDLLLPMIAGDNEVIKCLLDILEKLKGKTKETVGCLGGNIVSLIVKIDSSALENQDLSNTILAGADFSNANLSNVNFSYADLSSSDFNYTLGGVLSINCSYDGRLLITGDDEGDIRTWEQGVLSPVLAYKGHTASVQSVAVSPDGNTLVSASEDKTVRLWSLDSGECLQTLEGHTASVQSVAVSPDGNTLVSASEDKTVRLWSLDSGECLQTLEGHTASVQSVAVSPDGNTLVSASEDKTVRLWSLDSGECLQTLEGHTASVQSVAVSPDGNTLVSASEDKTVRLWSLDSGECLQTLEGHTASVQSVAVSPDGNTLVSASEDKTVRLWSLDSGECLQTLEGHTASVQSVAVSPDGNILITGSKDGALKVWSVYSGDCLKTLKGYSKFARPYENLNISSVIGLTEAQKEALESLGAITN
ncbi:MAG: NACHT domain-containing protein [Leptolyngbya sp. SIOISBB]|nr:NACHT domain-containing protein [Leptolyngbya sp. SIOISBB]